MVARHLRDAQRGGRDQAPLPRQGLGDPRAARLQELNASMSGAIERLTARLGRSPSIAEIAEELKTSPEEVLEAMEVGSAYSTVAVDRPGRRGGPRSTRDDRRRGRGFERSSSARRWSRRSTGCRRASARSCACASRRGSRRPRSRSGRAFPDARLEAHSQVSAGYARGTSAHTSERDELTRKRVKRRCWFV